MKLAPLLAALALSASPSLASELSDAMMRAGLDPDALAAAGVTSGQVAGIAEDVDAHLSGSGGALASADTDYTTARADVDRLRRLVRSGQGTAQDVTDLASAKSDLATAEAARESAIDAIFDAGTADLGAGVVADLEAIRANRHWHLPIEFLVEDRTEQEWVDLRAALADEKAAAAEGVAQDPACSQLLLTERADADVAAAKTAHDTNASAVQSAWDTATSS